MTITLVRNDQLTRGRKHTEIQSSFNGESHTNATIQYTVQHLLTVHTKNIYKTRTTDRPDAYSHILLYKFTAPFFVAMW